MLRSECRLRILYEYALMLVCMESSNEALFNTVSVVRPLFRPNSSRLRDAKATHNGLLAH